MRKNLKKMLSTVLVIGAIMVSSISAFAVSDVVDVSHKSFTAVANKDVTISSYYRVYDKLYGEVTAEELKIQGAWFKTTGGCDSGINTGVKRYSYSISATDTKGYGIYSKYHYTGTIKYNSQTKFVSIDVVY